MGGLRSEFDGAQDYDLVFRCVEKTITAHVPRILYHWRVHQVSTADNPISKTYAFEAGQRAIEAHLLRCGEHAEVLPELDRGFYRVRYKVQGNPKISILIPNKDHVKDLEKCLQSISKSIYKNYEITIIENNSKKAETFAYYDKIESDHIRILRWDGPFNYSAINNYAVSETDGEYLVLLNNDTEVIGKDWLGEMLANCQRKEVGIVGAKLYYPNGQVQHAGVIVGIRGIAGNMFRGLPKGYSGYLHKASTQQDLSAVTAACMMVKRSVYEEVGGFEEQLAVAFNDIDFCLKVRRCGYLVVYDPESLGRIWNTLVCFSLLVFFAGSHFAVFHPTGANQSYPTWLLIIEYFFFVDGLMMLMHFALLDKRRLRRRFALLDSYRGKKLAKLWLKALGVLLLCMIVIVAVANATGVVDTSAT